MTPRNTQIPEPIAQLQRQCTAEDFITIHHELGHNFYLRAYNKQPLFFQDSANDGFHEAIGDTIALSITPEYLVKMGFIDKAPDASKDIGLLLNRALHRVAFLPFGLLIDQWRWKVFSGEIPPEKYNEAWWALRLKYQGIAPPDSRTEKDFDPGAKFVRGARARSGRLVRDEHAGASGTFRCQPGFRGDRLFAGCHRGPSPGSLAATVSPDFVPVCRNDFL